MTTEQTWTRDDQERVRREAANGLAATRQETIAMLAEIDAIRAAGGPDVAQLHDDAHGQNCLGCRIGYALSEHEREGVRTTSEIDRLTAALKVASDRADAAEWQLRKLQGGSYAGMLDRT